MLKLGYRRAREIARAWDIDWERFRGIAERPDFPDPAEVVGATELWWLEILRHGKPHTTLVDARAMGLAGRRVYARYHADEVAMFPDMLRRDCEWWGMSVAEAGWRLGITKWGGQTESAVRDVGFCERGANGLTVTPRYQPVPDGTAAQGEPWSRHPSSRSGIVHHRLGGSSNPTPGTGLRRHRRRWPWASRDCRRRSTWLATTAYPSSSFAATRSIRHDCKGENPRAMRAPAKASSPGWARWVASAGLRKGCAELVPSLPFRA